MFSLASSDLKAFTRKKDVELVRKAFSKMKNEIQAMKRLEEGIGDAVCRGLEAVRACTS